MDIRHVIIPDTGAELIRGEITLAFAGLGIPVTRVHPDKLADPSSEQGLPALLEGRDKTLLCSVNFQGLQQMKATLALLEQHQSRAMVWCVDNPWNLLAGVRDPRWRSLLLFVTDETFVAPLRANGAERVFHLPLAACPASFGPHPQRDAAFPPPDDLAPIVFAGRSAFPGKESFFSGIQAPPALLLEAAAMLQQGERPHLSWWEDRLACDPLSFWPGKKARLPALGAEESSLSWRALCLRESAAVGRRLRMSRNSPETTGLDVFGDEGWRTLLPPESRLRPPVDYYARLPGIYAAARYSLALTSMQLPAGLTQRHFDVWMAGGCCITDNTPGLALFPEELARPVTFTRAQSIGEVVRALEAAPSRRESLRREWREYILRHHTYRHRAQTILEHL